MAPARSRRPGRAATASAAAPRRSVVYGPGSTTITAGPYSRRSGSRARLASEVTTWTPAAVGLGHRLLDPVAGAQGPGEDVLGQLGEVAVGVASVGEGAADAQRVGPLPDRGVQGAAAAGTPPAARLLEEHVHNGRGIAEPLHLRRNSSRLPPARSSSIASLDPLRGLQALLTHAPAELVQPLQEGLDGSLRVERRPWRRAHPGVVGVKALGGELRPDPLDVDGLRGRPPRRRSGRGTAARRS